MRKNRILFVLLIGIIPFAWGQGIEEDTFRPVLPSYLSGISVYWNLRLNTIVSIGNPIPLPINGSLGRSGKRPSNAKWIWVGAVRIQSRSDYAMSGTYQFRLLAGTVFPRNK